MNKFTLLVPCQSGLEAVVKRQLEKLGYMDTKAQNGRIEILDCDLSDVANLNMFLRSGERVLLKLAEFQCSDFDMLYDNLKKIEWESLLAADSKFVVTTKAVKSTLFAHHSIQGVGKKAIVDKLSEKYKTTLTESGSRATVEIDLQNDLATINLDTTGDGLFKRGYRTLAYSAPLKETTAAALLDLTVWHKEKSFSDIFCGSGTLPIEAAMKALNIAPGIFRRFDFCDWHWVDSKFFERSLERAKDGRIDFKLDILGSDINSSAISIAEYHAKRAGVEKFVKFRVGDAAEFKSEKAYGVNVSNIPFGERLDVGNADFGKLIGGVYKKLDNWNFYILTSDQNLERRFGRSADKKRKIFNGGLACSFYSFNGGKPPKSK